MSGFQRDFVTLKEGVEIGKLLKDHEAEFEVQFDDDEAYPTRADNSVESCLSFDQFQKIINLQVTSEDNIDDKDTPFSKYRRTMFNLTEDGKVLKHIVKPGVGLTMHENCVAYIHYRAYLEYQEVPFDSTVAQRGEERAVGYDLAGGLLPGLRLALLSMRRHEEAEFLVHPDLAFGRMGVPPRIPPDATILFIIKVEKFVDRAYVNLDDDDLDMYDRKKFMNVSKKAEDQFIQGNEEYLKGNFITASNLYKQSLNLLLNSRLANEKEERTWKRFLVQVYAKLCECYYKERNYKKVCALALDAIRECRQETFGNYKLMYLLGCANMKLGSFGYAEQRLKNAARLRPGSEEVTEAFNELEKRKKQAVEDEKVMAWKMFQPCKEKPPEGKTEDLNKKLR